MGGSALLVTVVALVIWGVPLESLGGEWIGFARDGLFYEAFVRTAVDSPWLSSWLRSDTFGWPEGMNLEYFFAGEFLHLLLLKMASSFVAVGPAMNIYVLLGFPLAMLTAYLFFRRAEITPMLSILLSTSFALLPYHFIRATDHVFLGMIWVIPLGLLPMLFAIQSLDLDGEHLLAGWGAGRRDFVVAIATSAVIGTSGVYYAFFTLIAWLPTGLYILARKPRNWGWLLSPVVLITTLSLSLAPTLLAQIREPPFSSPTERSPSDALRFTGTLADLDSGLVTGFVPIDRTYEALGISLLGQLAVLASFGVLVAGWLIPERSRSWRWPIENRWLVGLAMWYFLWWITGGLGYIFAILVTPQFRSLGRILPFLLLICLALAGRLLLSWLDHPSRVIQCALKGVLFGLLALDIVAQMLRPQLFEPTTMISERERVSSTLRQTQSSLGSTCPLGQLPILPAPEGLSPGKMPGQAGFEVGLVSAPSTVVSHGAVVNTEAAAWQAPYYYADAETGVQLLAALGFCGVVVDLRAYEDADAVVRQLTSLLGPPIAVDRDRASFSLGEIGAAAPDDRESLLRPAVAVAVPGESRAFNVPGGTWLSPAAGQEFEDGVAPVRIWNPSSQPRPVKIYSEGSDRDSALRVDWVLDTESDPLAVDELVVDAPADSFVDALVPVPEGSTSVVLRVCLIGEVVVTPQGLTRCGT